jgi:nucleoside phosphorylase
MNGQHQRRPSSCDEFDVAIICALPLETNAVLCSLDEYWPDAQHQYRKVSGDENIYAFGRCGRHAVVVVTLPRMGKSHAASAASTLKVSFKYIKLALLVGICGAVPFKADRTEIILGDVIISEMLVEFDFGREHEDGFERRRDTMFEAPRPPEEVAGLLNQLRTPFILNQLQNGLAQHLEGVMRSPMIETSYPVVSQDKLFEPTYTHRHQFGCDRCSTQDAVCSVAQAASCEQLGCDRNRLVPRSRLPVALADQRPTHRVHIGSIGTADTVMRSAKRRDALARKEGIIAFEMEGAGVWTKFNCLIVKGVCDYADSHKNKEWQGYAAAVAASAAKEVLANYAPPDRPSPPDIPDGESIQYLD